MVIRVHVQLSILLALRTLGRICCNYQYRSQGFLKMVDR